MTNDYTVGVHPARSSLWQKLLRVERIPDIHAVYGFFHGLRPGRHPLRVVSWPSTRYHVFWPSFAKRAIPVLNHLLMAPRLLAAWGNNGLVMVREFDNLWVLLLLPVLLAMRSRTLLNINQNFSPPLGRGIRGGALRVLVRLGFNFLWLDGEAGRADVARAYPGIRLITALFPVTPAPHGVRRQRDADRPYVVGFVGYFRAEKGGVAGVVEAASALAGMQGVQVKIGFWNDAQREQAASATEAGIELANTYEPAQYHQFIAACDAVVILAERSGYYYRHSGILMDCINRGTIPICPRYPVFESIVSRPVPVGATYGDIAELPSVVEAVMRDHERLCAGFVRHVALRSPRHVTIAIEQFMAPLPDCRIVRTFENKEEET